MFRSDKKSLLCVALVAVAAVSLSGYAKKETGVTVVQNKANVQCYGVNTPVDAYNINGKTYVNLKEVSGLLKTSTAYDSKSNTISIGDPKRASAAYYMPDLSAYPNLEDVIGLPPYAVSSDGSTVDFQFVTKGVSFQEMMPKLRSALQADGFAAATDAQYTSLVSGLPAFQNGKAENTLVKYKGKQDVTPYAIQIIDAGTDQNKLPVIYVKMAG